MTSSPPAFQPSCPSGGSWYACGNGTQFVGCCTSNPCNNNGCFQGNLRPASFAASAYGTFPDQECSSGSWYTCTGTNPPFMGCCASNPCAQGACPTADLRSGYLSKNPTIANQFNPQPPIAGASSSSSSVASSSSTSTPTAKSTTTSTIVPQQTPIPSESTPTGTIAGAAAGGALVVILIVLAVWYIMRRRRRSRQQNTPPTPGGYHSGQQVWSPVPQYEYSPYNDQKPLPVYSQRASSALMPLGSPGNSPHMVQQEIHEAGSHEVGHHQYSPRLSSQYSPHISSQYSPTWAGSDRNSGITAVTGLGVRGVNGNDERRRAELSG